MSWAILVLISSIYRLWPIPIGGLATIVIGLTVSILGSYLTLAGVAEFGSIRKVSGLEISKLVTTGIYRYSRNPQFLGFYLVLFGVSVVGSSGFALFLVVLAVIYGHYYIVKYEEPYLMKVFGEEYIRYISKTSRYFGFPRSIREESG